MGGAEAMSMSPPNCGRERARTADVASFFAEDEEDVPVEDGAVSSAAVADLRCAKAKVLDLEGALLVENAMEIAGALDQRKLAAGLHGFAREAAKSPHGAKVLEKVVHCLGTEDAA